MSTINRVFVSHASRPQLLVGHARSAHTHNLLSLCRRGLGLRLSAVLLLQLSHHSS